MGAVVRGAASATPHFGLPAELAELADRYEFFGELGRGGSAIVYRACDRSLGRDVAIKVVHARPTSPDDDAVARLAREARTVAQLQHPGIVTVYAVHRLQGGGLALVMQYVPGATLKQSIQRGGRFAPQRAEQILRDVADALAYAHGRQIIHRDVKPENIFLDADSGRALLADFGIARSGETDSMTMTGTAIGTPFYMSPEQVDGKVVDGRSDLYSLGLVAWEMLTGLRPWDGESLYHVIYKQKHDVLAPIEAFRPDVPRRLQYIVERMLQKPPAARWAGADGLLAQLDRTILPGDYTRWQAALPARVARHRAAIAAQRPTPAKDVERATALGAATVQFAKLDATEAADRGTPALAMTAAFSTRGHQPTAVLPEHGSSAESVAVPSADADPDATAADGGTTYDMVTPSWGSPGVDGANVPRARRQRMLRAAGFGAVLVLVAGAAASAWRWPRPENAPGVASPLASAARPIASDASPPRWPTRVPQPSGAGVGAAGAAGDTTTRDLIAVGARHVCELTHAGQAQCWGENDLSQLGAGITEARRDVPLPVAGVMTYVALAAGAAHTCGVTAAGDVYCWGANDLGQLGDGTTTTRTAPVRIGGVGTYRTVRGGTSHTCALDVDGSVRCWGDNSLGQIGDGSRGARFVPTAARLPSGTAAVAIATGGQHSCALLRDQRVLCWGSNIDGQLGVAGVAASDVPREVPGVRATRIAAGQAHTCAVLREATVRCWGRDEAGQVGVGPTGTAGAAGAGTSAPGTLIRLPGRDAVLSVAAGVSHNCALTRGGSVWCWGTVGSERRGVPIRVRRGSYVSLAAGPNVSCVVPSSSVAECWTTAGAAPPLIAPTPAGAVPPLIAPTPAPHAARRAPTRRRAPHSRRRA